KRLPSKPVKRFRSGCGRPCPPVSPQGGARMQLSFSRVLLILTLAFCLAPASPVGSVQSSEESALRELVERFFEAYARKDLAGSMALFSKKSPDYARRKQNMEETFAECEKIEVKSLAIREVKVEGQRALVRVVVEMSALDAKTGKPSSRRFGRMDRRL